MKGWLVAAGLVLGTFLGVPASVQAAVVWRGWDEGLEAAQELDRPLLVDVQTKWCGWCKRMRRDVYSRDDVQEALEKHFVTVRLDAEASDPAQYEKRRFTSRTLAAHFRVTGYPTTIFLGADGKHLVSVPGYVEAEKFLQVLRYVGEGHLQRGVTWETFQSQAQGRGAR